MVLLQFYRRLVMAFPQLNYGISISIYHSNAIVLPQQNQGSIQGSIIVKPWYARSSLPWFYNRKTVALSWLKTHGLTSVKPWYVVPIYHHKTIVFLQKNYGFTMVNPQFYHDLTTLKPWYVFPIYHNNTIILPQQSNGSTMVKPWFDRSNLP